MLESLVLHRSYGLYHRSVCLLAFSRASAAVLLFSSPLPERSMRGECSVSYYFRKALSAHVGVLLRGEVRTKSSPSLQQAELNGPG